MGSVNYIEIVVGVIIGLFFQYLITYIGNYRKSIKGSWHGTWYEIIPPQHDLSERWDRVKIQQDGPILKGTAKRVYPKEEKVRTYKFEGYTDSDRMIGFFYIDDQRIDQSSFIPITLVRDKGERNESVWRGSYTWPAYSSAEDIMSGNLKTGFVWWQRTHPTKSRLEVSNPQNPIIVEDL